MRRGGLKNSAALDILRAGRFAKLNVDTERESANGGERKLFARKLFARKLFANGGKGNYLLQKPTLA